MIRIKNKRFNIFLLALAVVGIMTSPALAAEVSLSVQVVERKPTDTVYDFYFSTVNQTYIETELIAGVSTQNLTRNIKWCKRP